MAGARSGRAKPVKENRPDTPATPSTRPKPLPGTQNAESELPAKPLSPIVAQIKTTVIERGISVAALAAALKIRPTKLQAWFEGTELPGLVHVEALLALLGLVSVTVANPNTEGPTASLRDYLPANDRELFDRLPTDLAEVMEGQIRDIQLQRIRLEREYALGIIEGVAYQKSLLYLNESLRRLAETYGKLRVTGALDQGGEGSTGPVELVFGSPKGAGYDAAMISQVNRRQALLDSIKSATKTAAETVQEKTQGSPESKSEQNNGET